ncbi:hypothetical protein ACWIGW_11265 [Nocardia brasiliensis]
MNTLLKNFILCDASDDWVSIRSVYDAARRLYPAEQAFPEAIEAIRWVLQQHLVELGEVGNAGWKPNGQPAEQQLADIQQAYTENPLPDAGAKWMFMRWMNLTPAGQEAVDNLRETDLDQLDTFY